MKKIVCIFILLSTNLYFAQKEYVASLQTHKYYFVNTENSLQNFFNIQISLQDTLKGNFNYEIQPGIILVDPALHLDFLFTYNSKSVFIKAGIMSYFGFGGGGNSGTSTEIYFLPIVGLGKDLGKNFIIEANYTFSYLTLGLGYQLNF